ncbi:hypothetical protein GE21DRAFT_1108 [Neurospora crassa]|uniref:Uncharacterized protein n=1 Tax=Neurospora crassa (strain ATCC 24698 / 74-OR23-1A / CBS 708.71 / DSM 1257 / FGSC 987) TaxID=367110 RepID=Q7SDT2_NEUCR|nr:hypothetical protein NCU03078 [Neurospora crassa OR74A]EAA34935.2 hypothetical protein NCU03078 [Neurospora crassa OR74A]KHE82370.1 hypothetical protein GE21DRAFT_1108 [Neurospora crassa]|eukprot:XP_964171.2 hypothetical protein NCU03078 [Neurospora crassa OR74A]
MSNANPTMPKVSNLPPVPAGARSGYLSPTKEEMLADLRHQLDDNNTDGSSVDSRGRRRRRNKGALQKQGGLAGPQTLPRLADTKPVRLQLGLNLDVELELKARLQGDVSLTLLVENKTPQKRPPSSTQLHLNSSTHSVTVDELFHLRLGRLRLHQRWLDHDVSPSLTAAVAVLIGMGGFLCGVLVSSASCCCCFSWPWSWIWVVQLLWDVMMINTISTMVPSWMTGMATTMTTTMMEMGSVAMEAAAATITTTSWSYFHVLLQQGLTSASFEWVGVTNIIGVGVMG